MNIIMTDKYLTGKEACQILGVHSRTLYNWDEVLYNTHSRR